MRNASKSQHQGLRTCSRSFSLKSNGHNVIVDGAKGFYFGSNFEGCKRFGGDYNISVSCGPLIKNEECIEKPTSRATHLQSEFFAQIKRPRNYRWWRERLLFWFEFRRMQAVLGGLKYIHELWSPDKNWGVHRIAEIKGYAAVVFVFCESEVVMKLWLLAFLVVFSVFVSWTMISPSRETFLEQIFY